MGNGKGVRPASPVLRGPVGSMQPLPSAQHCQYGVSGAAQRRGWACLENLRGGMGWSEANSAWVPLGSNPSIALLDLHRGSREAGPQSLTQAKPGDLISISSGCTGNSRRGTPAHTAPSRHPQPTPPLLFLSPLLAPLPRLLLGIHHVLQPEPAKKLHDSTFHSSGSVHHSCREHRAPATLEQGE